MRFAPSTSTTVRLASSMKLTSFSVSSACTAIRAAKYSTG